MAERPSVTAIRKQDHIGAAAEATGRASGKVILLGEHAVVYGVPAIVAGIAAGARARAVRLRNAGEVSYICIGGHIRAATDDGTDVGRALAAVIARCEVEPVRVDVQTDLPPGAGLGCSAAIGVAIVRALDALSKSSATPSETVERAMAWEKVFHGRPSGIDATAAVHGGCLWFSRSAGGADVRSIWLKRPLTLVVGYTGASSSTLEMVERVALLRKRRPLLAHQSFEAIRVLVEKARQAMTLGDHIQLGHLLRLNQAALTALALSTEAIDTMVRTANEAGALGAKLTGSGGGGCVVALTGADPAPVLSRWEREGFRAFSTLVAGSRHETPAKALRIDNEREIPNARTTTEVNP
jgi:mevalonate kinase